MLPYILKSIDRLNKSNVDFIIMPCNTLHIFIDKLREKSKVPFLSIIEETEKVIKKNGFRKIGLMGTTKTIESGIYQEILNDKNLEVVTPTKEDQKLVSDIEIKILRDNISVKDVRKMENILKNLIKRGVDSIILGCTDFQLIINQKDFEVEIFDSMTILADSTYKHMVNGSIIKT